MSLPAGHPYPDPACRVRFQLALQHELDAIRDLLLRKNAQYGDSATDPLRVFSRADAEEAIRVRIDDKLSRLARGTGDTEDTETDLLGYLLLLRVSRRLRGEGSAKQPREGA